MPTTRSPATIIYLPLDEPAGVSPSDQIGTLEDLAAVTGTAVPPVTDGWSGRARSFLPSATHAVVGADRVDADSLLNRNATVQAILALDLAHDAGPMTLFTRGLDGSASEYYALGLELEEQSGAPGYVEVRLFWQDSAGAIRTQLPGVFRAIGDGRFFLLTATRRWESTTSVVCRYYVGGQMLAEVRSTHGDIGGGTTGHTSVGGRKTAGTWGRFFSGAIDQFLVTNFEMPAEQVLATWQRIKSHQPDGVARIRALLPPGSPRSWLEAGTRMGALVKVAGHGAGLVAAHADELLQNWLPDRTYADQLTRWETLYGIAARSVESLDIRRERVLGFIRRENGYSVDKVKTALEGLLALPSADIEIMEFSNTITEDFTTLDALRWDTAGTWSIVSGALRFQVASSVDLRTDPLVVYARTPLSSGDGEVIAQVKLASVADLPADYSIAGLLLFNHLIYDVPLTRDALWFGVHKGLGSSVYRLAWCTYIAGEFALSYIHDIGSSFTPRYIRIRRSATVVGGFTLEYSADGFDTGMVATSIVGPESISYGGLGAVCPESDTLGAIDVTFDDFLLRTPQGDRPFAWYAYRDPLLPGQPDLIGANLVLRKLRPGHTHAAAINAKVLLCDDEGSGCDLGSLGGI